MHKIVTITGTKGKTTTMSIISYFIPKLENNAKVLSSSSTEGMFLNDQFVRNLTPDNYLSPYCNNGNIEHNYFISEATSHLLSENIYLNHSTDIAIFTGIEEHEHLDAHKTFSNYLNAKKKLFDKLAKDKIAIVNSDSKYHKQIVSDCKSKIITFGQNKDADFKIQYNPKNENNSEFQIHNNGKKIRIKTNLIGNFNHFNIVAAYITLLKLGFSSSKIVNQLEQFQGVPGRMEKYKLKGNRTVFIDYAHTPESLNNVLKLMRSLYPKKKLITVFGCGGNKTKSKRPIMGEISTDISDFVYITTDNPRHEKKISIIDDIVRGIKKNNYMTIINRERAIEEAILSNTNSVVIIAGKGNEKYIISSKKYKVVNCKHCNNKIKVDLKVPENLLIKYSDYKCLAKIASKYSLGAIENKYSISKIKKQKIKNYKKDELLKLRIKLASNCHIQKSLTTEDYEIITKPEIKTWTIIDNQNAELINKFNGKKTVSNIIRNSKFNTENSTNTFCENINTLINDSVLKVVS